MCSAQGRTAPKPVLNRPSHGRSDPSVRLWSRWKHSLRSWCPEVEILFPTASSMRTGRGCLRLLLLYPLPLSTLCSRNISCCQRQRPVLQPVECNSVLVTNIARHASGHCGNSIQRQSPVSKVSPPSWPAPVIPSQPLGSSDTEVVKSLNRSPRLPNSNSSSFPSNPRAAWSGASRRRLYSTRIMHRHTSVQATSGSEADGRGLLL
jgi:hypothetical protein